MKRFIKNNTKIIIGIIIGIVITSIVGVSAATILYNADQVSFSSKYSDFTATNVNEALNVLYNRSKYFDNISVTDCMSGTYYHNANSQWNINIGFIPTSFSIKFNNGATNVYLSYDKRFHNKITESYYTESTNQVTAGEYTTLYNISTNITSTFNTTSGTYKNAYNVYYIVCK